MSSLLGESAPIPGRVVTQGNLLFAANKEIMGNGFQSHDSPNKGERVPLV